jgi:hypothetical protein
MFSSTVNPCLELFCNCLAELKCWYRLILFMLLYHLKFILL